MSAFTSNASGVQDKCAVDTLDVKQDEEECECHSDKPRTLFCGQHGSLCCQECVDTTHRKCKNVSKVKKLAKGIFKSKYFKKVKTSIFDAKTELEQLMTARKQTIKRLGESRTDVLDMLKELREEVNTKLDDIEKRTVKELETLYRIQEKMYDTDINTCKDLLKNIDLRHKELDTSEVTESQLFIRMKCTQNKLIECKNIVTEMNQATGNDTFEFTTDPYLHRFLTSIRTLGKIHLSLSKSRSKVCDLGKEQLAINLLKMSNSKGPRIYTVCYGQEYSVALKQDEEEELCDIQGICQLENGNILLSDNSNKMLKQLDRKYAIVDHCTLPSEPFGVCCTGPQEAAVALNNSIIQFVSVVGKMHPIRSIVLDHDCHGLAYHSNNLYVTERAGTSVYVYNTFGYLLYTIHRDVSRGHIFSNTRYVCVCGDGTKLYVADWDKGLVSFSHSRLMSTLSHPDLSGATSVCADTEGNVFVCGYGSDNVIQFRNWGTKALGKVLSRSDGVYCPGSIWFDSAQCKLIVSSNPYDGSDTLRVFTLK